MTDFIIPHPEEQKSFYELRERYRDENHLRILGLLQDRNMLVGPLEYRFLDDGHKHAMDEMYGPQTFGLVDVPHSLIATLFDKADEVAIFESMTLPAGEGFEHDGPELDKPLEALTEDEQIAYVDRAIEASKEKS